MKNKIRIFKIKDIEQFNKKAKVDKEFLRSCKKAGELFGFRKKGNK